MDFNVFMSWRDVYTLSYNKLYYEKNNVNYYEYYNVTNNITLTYNFHKK